MADRHLAGVPHEDIEAERTDDGDPHEVGEGQVVLVHGQGNDQEEQDGEDADRPAGDGQRIERHVRLVRRFEYAALAMDHTRRAGAEPTGVGPGEASVRPRKSTLRCAKYSGHDWQPSPTQYPEDTGLTEASPGPTPVASTSRHAHDASRKSGDAETRAAQGPREEPTAAYAVVREDRRRPRTKCGEAHRRRSY